ncbi:threonylcarbamoyl-AMP synthase [Patescibacteria group bacterium]|nr:threonylcarbamoyl-AMP synthase [Patescibacteria group bacterium]MBU1721669.1 threonylcarbamoyl-AMP synthase [Patescibacteria group bacterium]MBU1900978.1 threonylcarbamoyl-AMP synthase [Patescibacteria group bacterium]
MKYIEEEQCDISDLIKELKRGKTIVYPTETCYGLGCDATNQKAVDQLFAIKERQQGKTMLVLMADIAMAKEYVIWNPLLDQLAQMYWPGPLTVVASVHADTALAKGIIHETETIAFRVTSHPLAHELVATLGVPLVSSSANIASLDSPYDVDDIKSMFAGKEHQPDILIDAGTLSHKAPSTIVRVDPDHISILRQGELIIAEDVGLV